MRERERETMPEIISAKCFGCGNIVKVPAALGGKKARCPKCTNTIVIPTQGDSNAELVNDSELPEVARDDEILEGEEISEEEQVPEGELVAEAPSRRSRREATGARRPGSSARHQKVGGGRGAPLRGGKARTSSAGLWIGIGVAAVILIVVLAVALGGGKGGGTKPKDDAGGKGAPAPAAKIDPLLEGRLQEYARAWERQDDKQIIKFHAFDPAEERAVRQSIIQLIEQGLKYEHAVVTAADGDSGSVTFTYTSAKGEANQQKTIQFTKVDGVWMVSGKP